MFPIEIFEEIWKHCDPVDLLRYKSVCSTWNSMIPRILQHTDIWYRKCLSDIPKTMWSSMFDTLMVPAFDPLDYHKAKNHPCVWIQLWTSWIHWRKLIHMEVTVETLEPVSNWISDRRIICITLQNNIIAVANSSNRLMLFNITNNEIVGIIGCRIPIVDVYLFGTDDCIGVVASLINKWTRLYTVTNKIVREYNCGTAGLDWKCYCFTTITTLGGELVKTKHKWLFPKYEDFFRPVEAYGDQYLLGRVRIHWISRVTHKSMHQWIKRPQVPIRRYLTFKPFVVACIGEFGEFGFLIPESDEWKIYNHKEKFRSPVTAVLFHVGILALGFESGEVHIFDVKDVANLQDLDFDEIESQIVRLNSTAIISLKVTEHNSAPYIVAATNRRVYFMKFASS